MKKVIVKVAQIAKLLTKDKLPVLLSTIGLHGEPRSRYIGAFQINDKGEFFLISPSNANKMQEIRKNPKAQVIFSAKDFQKVLTLSGEALIVEDLSLRRSIYEGRKSLKLYPVFNDFFGVIRFVPFQAEYLDLNVSNDPVLIKI